MAKRTRTPPLDNGTDDRPPSIDNDDGRNQRPWGEIVLYVLICVVCFVGGMWVLNLMISKADRLAALGLTGNLYYIVLVPMALCAAGFLFGVLRSYARYSGKHDNHVLELGGAVVGAALVVIGGFYLVPSVAPFPLTVYVHGQGGPHDIVLKNSGYVILDLGPERRREPIHENGEAYFPSIPVNFRNQEVPVWVESDAYEPSNPDEKQRLAAASLYLSVRKKPGRISGRVQDENANPVSGALIHVAGLSATTDSAGHFGFVIPGDSMQEELYLESLAPGYESVNFKVVPNANPLTIQLRHTR